MRVPQNPRQGRTEVLPSCTGSGQFWGERKFSCFMFEERGHRQESVFLIFRRSHARVRERESSPASGRCHRLRFGVLLWWIRPRATQTSRTRETRTVPDTYRANLRLGLKKKKLCRVRQRPQIKVTRAPTLSRKLKNAICGFHGHHSSILFDKNTNIHNLSIFNWLSIDFHCLMGSGLSSIEQLVSFPIDW